MQLEDLKRLKELNKVGRICSKKTNEYSKDLIKGLLFRVNLYRKQKQFLQKKLREVCNAKRKG